MSYTFTRKASDPDLIVEEVGDGALLIASRPDFVILPQELGSGRCNVLEIHKLPWNGEGSYTHYKLDKIINGKDLWVAKVDQYYWYTR
jgi:hypothetical protein